MAGEIVDKALALTGQQQANPVAMAKQVASMPPARQLSPMGLYSQGAETAAALPQAKGSPQQMKAMLKGVKQEELAGYDDAFAGKPSVTRDEIAAHFKERMPQIEETVLGTPKPEQMKILRDEYARAEYGEDFSGLASEYKRRIDDLIMDRRSTTKFQQYSLPGGENYREVLLKLPSEKIPTVDKKGGSYGFTDSSGHRRDYWSEEEAQKAARSFYRGSGDFKSQHWDDPNVLAHLRMADRTGPNGEKILHVEEIQSDWGQKGKKEGFKVPLTPELESSANAIIESKLQPGAEFMNPSWRTKEGKVDPRAVTPSYVEFLEKNGTISPDEAQTLKVWNKARGFDASGVPTAPYVTNTQAWTDLALKRALREAAEGGYDKLVWTPGAEQAKRYSLSTHVDRIAYDPELKELSYVQKGVNGWQTHPENLEPNGLAAVIGKEAADKLLAQEVAPLSGNHVLEAPDLVFGGEGMKGYYDKIVPKSLQELVKKHDPEAKVGYTDVMLPPKGGAGHNNPPFAAPGIDITPKMRESILKGQPAFKRGGAIPLHPALNIPGVHIRTAEAGEPFFHGEK